MAVTAREAVVTVKVSEGQARRRGAAGKKREINKHLFMYTRRIQYRRRRATMRKIPSSLTVIYNRRQRYTLLSCSVKYDKWCVTENPRNPQTYSYTKLHCARKVAGYEIIFVETMTRRDLIITFSILKPTREREKRGKERRERRKYCRIFTFLSMDTRKSVILRFSATMSREIVIPKYESRDNLQK